MGPKKGGAPKAKPKAAAKAAAKAASKTAAKAAGKSKPKAKAAGKAKAAPKKDSKSKDTSKKDAPKKETKERKKRAANPFWLKEKPTHLFEPRPRLIGIGQDLPPKHRDLTRFVKWPAYVRRQRQKRVLQKRLHVPPAINQFNNTADRHLKKELFKFALKYKPESPAQRMDRLKKEAALKLKDPKTPISVPPPRLYFGVQRIYRLVELKRAKMVFIAHDVDPIEIVLCLPALCKKQGIPWVIVKGKANLGQLVGYRTATCVAIVDIKDEDKAEFQKLRESVQTTFIDRYEDLNKKWGGLKLSVKSRQQLAKKQRLAAADKK